MKILCFLLLAPVAMASPAVSSGGLAPLVGLDATSVGSTPEAEVQRMDPGGNEGLFRALHLQRRTAVRYLIEQIGRHDLEVIRMVGMELIDRDDIGLYVPYTLSSVFQTARSRGIQDLLKIDKFRRLLIWYLKHYYVYRNATPRYILPDGDAPHGGVLLALAHAYRIELVVYERNNDSVAQRVLEYPLDQPLDRVILLRSEHRYDVLRLPSEQRDFRSVRLKYTQQETWPLLHEFSPLRAPAMTLVINLGETLTIGPGPGFRLRSHVLDFLHWLRQMTGVEIVLWTAMDRKEALPMIEQLEQHGIMFDEVIYQDNRWFSHTLNTPYIKKLELLGRDMRRVVMVENSAEAVRLDKSNVILVEGFVDQTEDRTFHNLIKVLHKLRERVGLGESVSDILLEPSKEMCSLLELVTPWALGTFLRVLSKQKMNQTSGAACSGPTL